MDLFVSGFHLKRRRWVVSGGSDAELRARTVELADSRGNYSSGVRGFRGARISEPYRFASDATSMRHGIHSRI